MLRSPQIWVHFLWLQWKRSDLWLGIELFTIRLSIRHISNDVEDLSSWHCPPRDVTVQPMPGGINFPRLIVKRFSCRPGKRATAVETWAHQKLNSPIYFFSRIVKRAFRDPLAYNPKYYQEKFTISGCPVDAVLENPSWTWTSWRHRHTRGLIVQLIYSVTRAQESKRTFQDPQA